jgi:hypothetical protein
MIDILQNSLGVAFLITSVFDAIKYHWNAVKIRSLKTARGHSRKFINVAILNDVVRMAYGFSVADWYIVVSSLLAMIFMGELFLMIYLHYPYRYRNLKGFKRPNIVKYLWNSILPNRWAGRI